MSGESTQGPRGADSTGKMVGGYEILGEIGRGAMGAVFKARQVSTDRAVALKILPPRLAKDQQFIERFTREAHAAAQLNHPNIVQAIDVGQAGVYYYFAMEFVDGQSLQKLLDTEGDVPERRALEIARDVAAALDHAHKAGLIHRDIKPDNILISSAGMTKLADLGLARETESTDIRMTQAGLAIGTPCYMSPEQIRAEPDVDGRTDVYSLGATLYHMLTGSPPFTGRTNAEVMSKHLTEAPPDPRKSNPNVSPKAAAIVRKAMAKDPAQRYATATDLQADIEKVLGVERGVPQSASARTTLSPRRRRHARPRRHMGLLWPIGGGVAALVVLVAFLFSGLQSGRERPVGTKPDEGAVQQKSGEPANASPEELAMLERLRTDVAALMGKDKFADALERIWSLRKSSLADTTKAELAQLGEDVMKLAAGRWEDIAGQADTAIQQKDYTKARVVLKPAESFGIPEYAEKAKKKQAEIESREKNQLQWAKWDELKKTAKGLAESGDYDKAATTLDQGKDLPLDGIADLIAQGKLDLDTIRRKAAEDAIADYRTESDAVWALFKERKYNEADKLLADLAKKPEYRPAANLIEADVEASRLLKQFWAAVEKGLSARTGKFVAVAGAAGNLVSVGNGEVSIKTGDGEVKRSIYQLTLKQAMAYAEGGGAPLPPLAVAVARLAEGEELEEADKALTTAGDAKCAGVWRDRLAKLLPAAREALASQAWKRIEAAEKGDLSKAGAAELAAALTEFEKKYGATAFAESVAKDMAEVRGKVAALPAKIVTAPELKRTLAIDLGGGVKMEFVLVRQGTFQMGSEDRDVNGKPLHKVTITQPFYLGKYEVTQEQWERVMMNNMSSFKGPRNPVNSVSWNDCQEFLNKLNARGKNRVLFRLPTEAEWEYACRAGSSAKYCYGDDVNQLDEYAWSRKNSDGKPHPVGEKKPNAWGLYDMHGNVYEWCADWFGKNYSGESPNDDPQGPKTGETRVVRGGSWFHNYASCLSASRCSELAYQRNSSFGFRVVCSAGPELRVPPPDARKEPAHEDKTPPKDNATENAL